MSKSESIQESYHAVLTPGGDAERLSKGLYIRCCFSS